MTARSSLRRTQRTGICKRYESTFVRARRGTSRTGELDHSHLIPVRCACTRRSRCARARARVVACACVVCVARHGPRRRCRAHSQASKHGRRRERCATRGATDGVAAHTERSRAGSARHVLCSHGARHGTRRAPWEALQFHGSSALLARPGRARARRRRPGRRRPGRRRPSANGTLPS